MCRKVQGSRACVETSLKSQKQSHHSQADVVAHLVFLESTLSAHRKLKMFVHFRIVDPSLALFYFIF